MQRPTRFVRTLAAATRNQRPWRLLLLVLIVAVLVLALIPSPTKGTSLGWDKLNHAVAFAALTVSGCLGFPGSRRTVLALLLALLAFGGLIEVLQYFVPGRDSEWADLLADAVGLGCGAVLAPGALRTARRMPPLA